MGDGSGVSHALYFHVTFYGLDYRLAVQIPGFNPELVVSEFPKIEAQPDNHRKLGMNTGEIPGNDSTQVWERVPMKGRLAHGHE